MPDMLMAHAAAGFGGHGTLSGALTGVSTIINMVTYGEVRDAWQQNSQIVDRLFFWYADQDFPPERFDDISKMPKQVKAKAKMPLCHTSLSSWAMAADENISTDAKKERCAKVAGEVVYTVTQHLNEFFEGKWTPAVWAPSPRVTCMHSPAARAMRSSVTSHSRADWVQARVPEPVRSSSSADQDRDVRQRRHRARRRDDLLE